MVLSYDEPPACVGYRLSIIKEVCIAESYKVTDSVVWEKDLKILPVNTT